ncbi:unnamed protein product [Rodentolepis nana]|uniref:Clathrin_bdg domain-containing protein n=1 Tax=Rodentolepis nana TaxID=102285 RepID=A0A0R3T3G4_RODNA|nr:unnamed protein product [Rodentolepis nana]
MSEVSGFSPVHNADANISNDLGATNEFQSSNILCLKLTNGLHLCSNDEGHTTEALVNEPISSKGNYYRSENGGRNKLLPFDSLNSLEDCVFHVSKINDSTHDSLVSQEIGNRANPVEVMENIEINIKCEEVDGEFECPNKLLSDVRNCVILYDKEPYADCAQKANTDCQYNVLTKANSYISTDDSTDFDEHEEILNTVFQLPYVQETEKDEDFEDFATHERKGKGEILEYSESDKQDSISVTANLDTSFLTRPCAQDIVNVDDFGNFVAHNERKQDENFVCSVQNIQKNFVDNISSAVTVHDAVEKESCYDADDFQNFSGFKSAEPQGIIKSSDDESEKNDFADFSTFQNAELTPPPSRPPETNSFIKNILSHIGSALDMTFSTDKQAGLGTFIPSQNPFTSPKDSGFLARLWCNGCSETAESLLTSVSNHPLSFATQQVWNTSYTYSMYLEAIGVDNQSTHPVISNQIKLLEPTPIDHNVTPSCPTPSKTTQSTESPSSESYRLANGPSSDLFTGESIIKSASDADLELFEELLSKPSTTKPTGPIADLEAEFLHSVIPPPSVIQNPAPSLPTSFLSKIPITNTSTNEIPENVSNVLKQLPDFSYLRKSILAFPVLEQTD